MRQLLLYVHEELPMRESRELTAKLSKEGDQALKDVISGIHLEKAEHQFESAEQHARWFKQYRMEPPALSVPPQAKTISFSFLRMGSIAASILILIGIGYLLTRPSTPQEVYAEAVLRHPHLNEDGNLRSHAQANSLANPFDEKMNQVEAAYDAKEFDKAIALLDQISTDTLDNYQQTLILYYQGRSLLAINKTEEAKQILLSLSDEPSDLLYQSALFQLGLCYLKQGEEQEIKTFFGALSNNQNANGNNRRWAQEVLDQLGV